jgi:hypothetical protein
LRRADTRHTPAKAGGLLAHELAHVVQQRSSTRAAGFSPANCELGQVQSPAEHEADKVANRIDAGDNVKVQNQSSHEVQRAWDWNRFGKGALLGALAGSALAGVVGGKYGPTAALVGIGASALAGGLIGGLTGKGPSCGSEQRGKISAAASKASTWLKSAIGRLDEFMAKPADAARQWIGAIFDQAFHSRDSQVVDHVRGRLNQIQTRLGKQDHLTYECHTASDTECKTAGAYTSRGSNQIVICANFFNPGDDWRAEALVHEVAHTLVGGKILQTEATTPTGRIGCLPRRKLSPTRSRTGCSSKNWSRATPRLLARTTLQPAVR